MEHCFKSGSESETGFALPDHCVLEVSGIDAWAFAQGQFMNDLRPLEDGRWQWNGWLDAKGRVQAFFALHQESRERLVAVLRMPPAAATPVVEQLRRYVLRSKVRLQLLDDRIAVGRFSTPAAAHMASEGTPPLRLPGDTPRELWIAPASAPLAERTTELDQRWRRADVEAGLPWLPPESVGAYTPQMLSLQRWAAYSVRKGCYPGQEIVARTHFLGEAKRRLFLIATDVALAPGEVVTAGDRAIGSVVCGSLDANGFVGLAVLGGEGDAELTANGRPLAVKPLPELGEDKPSPA